MLPERVSKRSKSTLFASEMPMKRSVVMEERSSIDLYASNKPTRMSSLNGPTMDLRSSILLGSKILYPNASFILKKVRRIFYTHLKSYFTSIKRKRKVLINLELLNSKTKRTLLSCLTQIRLFAQWQKGGKLTQVISRNKKPSLLFFTLVRISQGCMKFSLQKIKDSVKRKSQVCFFLVTLDSLTRKGVDHYFLRKCFSLFKTVAQRNVLKINSVPQFQNAFMKIMLRNKEDFFRKVFEQIKLKSLETVLDTKKQLSTKLNEATVEKAKILLQEKQKLRNFKNDLDHLSSDSAKAKYEIRRDINLYRNKLKQDEKKMKKVVIQVQNQNSILEKKLEELLKIKNKRFSKLNNQGNFQLTKALYKQIVESTANKAGQIKLRSVTKNLPIDEQQIQKLDEFHLFINQKLRQQIGTYENWTVFDTASQQQQLIYDQNSGLKSIIQILVQRKLYCDIESPIIQHKIIDEQH